MSCYHPIPAYRTQEKTGTGKSVILFTKSHSKTSTEIRVKCGQCVGCRLDKSRQWATRMMHEASLHQENAFITLTYDDDNLPWDLSLNKSHFQNFMKRLRKKFSSKKIRFYQAGEYGEATPDNDFMARPHYHAILFNHQFQDREPISEREGIILYSSDTLSDIWGNGLCSTGEVTFESAAYVARYVLKKITGDQAEQHYITTHPLTGETIELQPEYSTMSRRPGISADWFDTFKSDVYPKDSITVRGVPQNPPPYYDVLLERDDPVAIEALKIARKRNARKYLKDNTPERLAARETVKKAQLSQLRRTL